MDLNRGQRTGYESFGRLARVLVNEIPRHERQSPSFSTNFLGILVTMLVEYLATLLVNRGNLKLPLSRDGSIPVVCDWVARGHARKDFWPLTSKSLDLRQIERILRATKPIELRDENAATESASAQKFPGIPSR
ncbi:10642_t:CDS:2 [Acaulospora colombiana]|uniref:10642_t:CDS:1 n=1 Tax=Acaulospora colombiana TaxID=27376 RepID=A0ACA9NUU3_9GLOM|nr:10642_t:CDS:2 [Acaulospora colombiana]